MCETRGPKAKRNESEQKEMNKLECCAYEPPNNQYLSLVCDMWYFFVLSIYYKPVTFLVISAIIANTQLTKIRVPR